MRANGPWIVLDESENESGFSIIPGTKNIAFRNFNGVIGYAGNVFISVSEDGESYVLVKVAHPESAGFVTVISSIPFVADSSESFRAAVLASGLTEEYATINVFIEFDFVI